MFILNVANLYSNIPYELGKQAISFCIEKYLETLQPRFISDYIELILNNNSFQFNNVNYIQTLGTAMRTKMVLTYATLTLAYLEENLYEIIGKKYNNIKTEFIRSWKRYLDDCFIFWKCPWDNINDLLNLLHNLHPNTALKNKHF